MPVSEVVVKKMWGSAWDEDQMASKQRNLKTALELYPKQTGAHIEAGMCTNFISYMQLDKDCV